MEKMLEEEVRQAAAQSAARSAETAEVLRAARGVAAAQRVVTDQRKGQQQAIEEDPLLPKKAAPVVPNMSGLVPLFTNGKSHRAAEAERASTPDLPWKPPTRQRESANRELRGRRALRDLGILANVQAETRAISAHSCSAVALRGLRKELAAAEAEAARQERLHPEPEPATTRYDKFGKPIKQPVVEPVVARELTEAHALVESLRARIRTKENVCCASRLCAKCGQLRDLRAVLSEAYRLLVDQEQPSKALVALRNYTCEFAGPPPRPVVMLEVGALYACDDMKGAARVLLAYMDQGGSHDLQLTRLYHRLLAKTRMHRPYFEAGSLHLPDEPEPPADEPEPESEVFLAEQWEHRLRRLRDLWITQPSPQDAVESLRNELRDNIELISEIYLFLCDQQGYGRHDPTRPVEDLFAPKKKNKKKQAGTKALAEEASAKAKEAAVAATEETGAVGQLHLAAAEASLEAARAQLAALRTEKEEHIAELQQLAHDTVHPLVHHVFSSISLLREAHAGRDDAAAEHRERPPAWEDALAMLAEPEFLDSLLELQHEGLSATARELLQGQLEDAFGDDLSAEAIQVVCDAKIVHALCAWVLAINSTSAAVVAADASDSEAESGEESDSSADNEQLLAAQSFVEERPKTASEDGHGLALVLDPGEFESRCHSSGIRLRQFQWWRICKHCTFMSPGLRQYQIDRLFAYIVSDHHQKNLVLLPEDDYMFPTAQSTSVATDPDETRSTSVMSAAVSAVSSPGAASTVGGLGQTMAGHTAMGNSLIYSGISTKWAYDARERDPHNPHISANLYDFVEMVVRVASARYSDVPSLAGRFRILVKKQILPVWITWKDEFDKQKQMTAVSNDADDARLAAIDKGSVPKGGTALCKFLPKFWDADIQEMLATVEVKLRKIYHFISDTERGDPLALLCFNKVLKYFHICNLLDPALNVKRLANITSEIVGDPDVAPQEHSNNEEILLTYEEFLESLGRFGKAKINMHGQELDPALVARIGEAGATTYRNLEMMLENVFFLVGQKMPGRL